MQELIAQPLTANLYAPYGDVLMASPRGEAGLSGNQGTALRFPRLAGVVNARPQKALPNLGIFRCSPRTMWPMGLALLEKHPLSTQVFVPMNASRYLGVVARGGDAPELETLAAFVATGTQAITYLPGIWHHPMIALDTDTDFACLVWEDGTPDDCEVFAFDEGAGPHVRLAR